MARDWALIEFRPGRYAKISPNGDFLGMATEAEVRAWFGAGGRVRKPPPPRATASPTPRQTEPPPAATPPRAEPKPLPPFLEHLRGVAEPVPPEPVESPATQEPRPLPPFLLRKLAQSQPPEVTAEPEVLAGSPTILAKEPSSSATPDPVGTTPEGYRSAAQPAKAELDRVRQSPDLLDPDKVPERAQPEEMPMQALLLPGEADEDEPNEEGQGTEEEEGQLLPFSGQPSPTGRARPAVASAPPSAETPSQDGAGRWLWLDPRQDARHNPMAFDLAAFLQRAIALFQSKDWTGGQKPGRLAIHPDQMADGLSALADSLGLEIECDPLVNPGTYRLALPRDKTR